jgi:DNA-binding transcriptional ArsR family regulator
MHVAQDRVEQIFKTLADPSRRSIYETIVQHGEISVSELAAGASISQPAVSQHLKALRSSGLVDERREGRFVLYRPVGIGLEPLTDWVSVYAVFWAGRFERLREVLKEIEP